MTNDKTVTMSRELIEAYIASAEGYDDSALRSELRALLAAPVVERQEPSSPHVVGYMPDSPDGDPLITLESHQDYVAELQASVERLTERCIEKDALISEMDRIGSAAMALPNASPPAPVAEQHPIAYMRNEGTRNNLVQCSFTCPGAFGVYRGPQSLSSVPAPVAADLCPHCEKRTQGLDGESKWCTYCGGKL